MRHPLFSSALRLGVGGGLGVAASSLVACSFLTSVGGLAGGDGTGTAGSLQAPAEDASNGGAPGAFGASNDAGSSPGNLEGTGRATTGEDAALAPGDDASLAEAGLPTPSPSQSPCSDGGVLCNGTCIDPTSDPMNCNGCGNVCASGLCGATLSAPMTTAPAGWDFNGSAALDPAAPSAELTKAGVMYQAGTVFYHDPITVSAMHAQFEFRIGVEGGSRSDGMGFVIGQSGPTAVGGVGGGLGMAGLAGFGVELDIFNNETCGDTSADHVGIDDLTSCPGGTPTSLYETDITSMLDLGDTHWHTANVTLASGALSLMIDGTSLIGAVTLPGFQATEPYYVGFAGATGGIAAPDGGPGGYRQEVKNVVLTFPTPECL